MPYLIVPVKMDFTMIKIMNAKNVVKNVVNAVISILAQNVKLKLILIEIWI